jgi:hypothetical protein
MNLEVGKKEREREIEGGREREGEKEREMERKKEGWQNR